MKLKMIIHNFDEQMISIGASAYYWNRTAQQEEKTQSVGDEIPTIESVFDLKSGVRAELVDRSGSMVIIEIDKLSLLKIPSQAKPGVD